MKATETDNLPRLGWDLAVEFDWELHGEVEVFNVPLIIAPSDCEAPVVVMGPVKWPSGMERCSGCVADALCVAASDAADHLVQEGYDPVETRWLLIQDDFRVGVLRLRWRTPYAWLQPGPLDLPSVDSVEIEWKAMEGLHEVRRYLDTHYGCSGRNAVEVGRRLGWKWARSDASVA